MSRSPRQIRGLMVAALLMTLGGLAGGARADSIELDRRGRVENVSVRSIANGQIVYTDAAGKAQRQPMENVKAISFAGIVELDDAAAATEQLDHKRAIELLLRAHVRATTKAQRLWIRAMLARSHSAAGEYVEASGHAAAVFIMDDHKYWRTLVPRGSANAPTYAAVAEAMHHLQDADSSVRDQRLAVSIDQMMGVITPIHARATRGHSGTPHEPGTTLSGVSIDEIKRQLGQETAPRETDATEHPPGAATGASDSTGGDANQLPDGSTSGTAGGSGISGRSDTSGGSGASGGDSAASIDRLLDQQRFADALAACDRVGARPGNRDLSRFLFQYGQAYRGAGRPREALVMFVRCAVLYPDEADAPAALIETAIIHRDVLDKPDVARRLLERAKHSAVMLGQDPQLQRATRELNAIQ